MAICPPQGLALPPGSHLPDRLCRLRLGRRKGRGGAEDLDTLKEKIETTDEKVEKVDAKLDAMIQVMIQAFPEFKKAAQERAQENRDSKEVQESLTGDAP
jgi:hypothetical protein